MLKDSIIRLGIIGTSEGNGHPYSWSAIFNGYSKAAMGKCPYPAIPEYLAQQNFPNTQIQSAQVTHIWTQDKDTSKHIALASNIETIVTNYTDMIGHVDAILLARDDFKNHYELSAPFIKANLPIYIDKPLANTVKDARSILDSRLYADQIFTCSALFFAKEFQLSQEQLDHIGAIKHITASAPKDWNKYAIHIIDPLLRIIGFNRNIVTSTIQKTKKQKKVTLLWDDNITTTLISLGPTKEPFSIVLTGEKGEIRLVFKDTFYAFKKSLKTFIEIVQKQRATISQQHTLKVIEVIEKGNEE